MPLLPATVLAANSAQLNRDATILSLAIVLFLTVVVVFLIWWVSRKRRSFLARQRALFRAGKYTLSDADALAADVQRRDGQLSKRNRRALERAAELRSEARRTLDRGTTDAELAGANETAAGAVVLLQGVRQRMGVEVAQPAARCFYCGTDEGPFSHARIEGEDGAALDVHVCGGCSAIRDSGRLPPIALASYHGMDVPWWAVPNNPWFDVYGGRAWQYWLPVLTGESLEAWLVDTGSETATPAATTSP